MWMIIPRDFEETMGPKVQADSQTIQVDIFNIFEYIDKQRCTNVNANNYEYKYFCNIN
jgi:hypothetical protein